MGRGISGRRDGHTLAPSLVVKLSKIRCGYCFGNDPSTSGRCSILSTKMVRVVRRRGRYWNAEQRRMNVKKEEISPSTSRSLCSLSWGDGRQEEGERWWEDIVPHDAVKNAEVGGGAEGQVTHKHSVCRAK